jgi:hypothetical protein
MTVADDDKLDDDVLASLARLRTWDISPRRARRLRGLCHAMLQAEPSVERWSSLVSFSPFRRHIAAALGGAWCLAYLMEIIRSTAAIYANVGTP